MAQIKRLVDKDEDDFTLNEPMTAYQFVKGYLCHRHKELASYLLENDGSIRPIILIFHGSERVGSESQKFLQDEDIVTIMPPITGG